MSRKNISIEDTSSQGANELEVGRPIPRHMKNKTFDCNSCNETTNRGRQPGTGFCNSFNRI